jgi:diguanylate cyclase (GGDEF)-like protein
MALPRFNLRAFPDSPYAAELQRRAASRRFSPALEQEYARAQLNENRILIRAACTFAACIVAVREVELAFGGAPNHTRLIISGAMLIAAVLLASAAWSPRFERAYLPIARVLVPLRNAFATLPIAATAAQGHGEALMFLPLMMIGPFFLLGLSLRVAFVAVAATVAAFAVSAAAFGLPEAVTFNACVLLSMMIVACTIAARRLDERSRRSFLEGHLIEDLAQHDGLTGLKNRRVFDEHLARLWHQATEDGRNIAILLADVDHFKAYNDRHGHQAGDRTLRQTAKLLEKFVEDAGGLLARYGGEEFAAILYDVDSRRAQDTAQRMRRAVADSAGTTISVGVAVVAPTDERKPRGALQLADQALYKAKIGGRNRVELMDETEYSLLVTGVFSKASLAREG